MSLVGHRIDETKVVVSRAAKYISQGLIYFKDFPAGGFLRNLEFTNAKFLRQSSYVAVKFLRDKKCALHT